MIGYWDPEFEPSIKDRGLLMRYGDFLSSLSLASSYSWGGEGDSWQVNRLMVRPNNIEHAQVFVDANTGAYAQFVHKIRRHAQFVDVSYASNVILF